MRPIVLGGLQRLAVNCDTCIVDHDVESAAFEDRSHAGGVGHVQSRRLRLPAAAFDLCTEALQPVDTPCCRGDLGALFGENPREMSPEAGRRAGDQCRFPAQFHHDLSEGLWQLQCVSAINDMISSWEAPISARDQWHSFGAHAKERRGSIDLLQNPPSQRQSDTTRDYARATERMLDYLDQPLLNLCRNRRCPTCHGNAACKWLARHAGNTAPMGHRHFVFTWPRAVAHIAFANRGAVIGILFRFAHGTCGPSPPTRVSEAGASADSVSCTLGSRGYSASATACRRRRG